MQDNMMKDTNRSGFVKKLLKNNVTLILGVLILMIVVASVFSPHFLTLFNLQSLMRDLAFIGMIAVAQSLLLLIGELDLSVGKTATLSGVFGGLLMTTLHVNPFLSFFLALISGAILGAINGMTYGGADVYFSAITPSATGGQPASAYFMIKDGIAPSMVAVMLLINLVMYTAALLISSIAVFIFGGDLFWEFSLAGKILVAFGAAVLVVLIFGFFLLLKKTSFLHGIFDKILKGAGN